MNWNTMNYVIEIARQRSFSKAAEKLYIAQPSLSQSIKALEQELGTPIFERSPVKLTYAGELFVNWAEKTLAARDDTFRQISDIEDGTKTRLIIGVSFSRGAYLFPKVMKKFSQIRPNCSVTLIEEPTNLLTQHDDLDLLIDVLHNEPPYQRGIVLAEERIMLAVPKRFKITTIGEKGGYPLIQLKDFKDMPFIALSEDQMLRKMMLTLCSNSEFVPKIAMECRSLQTAYSIAVEGVGAVLVPEFFVKHTTVSNELEYCMIDDSAAVREMAINYRSDRYLTRDAEIMSELIKELLKDE